MNYSEQNKNMCEFGTYDQAHDLQIPGLEIIQILGEGVQGAAYKVLYGGYWACAKKFNYIEDMEQEYNMIIEAQESGWVPCIMNAKWNQGVIIMELVEGKTLYDFIFDDQPSSQLVHLVMTNVLEALLDLHETGVIHNDLHMKNIMVDTANDYDIKIIDFGLAKMEGESPYPDISMQDILKYPHLDPNLGEGGPCSPNTDFYSFGDCLSNIAHLYSCPVYENYADNLRNRTTPTLDLDHFLASNCRDCKFCYYSGNCNRYTYNIGYAQIDQDVDQVFQGNESCTDNNFQNCYQEYLHQPREYLQEFCDSVSVYLSDDKDQCDSFYNDEGCYDHPKSVLKTIFDLPSSSLIEGRSSGERRNSNDESQCRLEGEKEVILVSPKKSSIIRSFWAATKYFGKIFRRFCICGVVERE